MEPCRNPRHPGLRSEAETKSICKHINPANKQNSVFGKCMLHNPVLTAEMFEDCTYDYCAFVDEPDKMNILCKVIESFASECRDQNLLGSWRSETLCRK